MTKKRDTAQQRLIASARKALAARNAVAPVPAYNAKAARLDAAGKRACRAENQPTPEQEAKATYIEADVNERVVNSSGEGTKIKLGRAFQRQARFESIEDITLPQLFALRRYRRAGDVAAQSPVKSALDVGPGGGGGDGAWAAISRLEAIVFADVGLRLIEATIPSNLLPTLRLVALEDMDFKAAAVALYGTASSRRRERVRADFLAAAELLVQPASAKEGTAKPEQTAATALATAVVVPDAFKDERGYMRPLHEVADVIRAQHAGLDDEAA